MSALALDIGTYTIKAVQGKTGAEPNVERAAEIFNTDGLAVPTEEVHIQKLAETLNAFIADHKLSIRDIRLSMPEGVVSTKVITIPYLSDAELASAIGWQAEQHIPIPPEELALEYEVLYRPQKNDRNAQMRVLLVGTKKTLVANYISVFTQLGVEPSMMETQILSVIRSLQFKQDDTTTLVAHVGASSMNIAVVHQGEVAFVFNHLSGGQMLTRSLEQTIGLDPQQAEQYKRTYGLDPAQFQGKVSAALTPAVKILTDEILKAMRFFVNQFPSASVDRVLLSGGSAQLPGLIQYATDQLGVEVLLAAPFASASGAIPDTNHPSYSVCMGLLMREK